MKSKAQTPTSSNSKESFRGGSPSGRMGASLAAFPGGRHGHTQSKHFIVAELVAEILGFGLLELELLLEVVEGCFVGGDGIPEGGGERWMGSLGRRRRRSGPGAAESVSEGVKLAEFGDDGSIGSLHAVGVPGAVGVLEGAVGALDGRDGVKDVGEQGLEVHGMLLERSRSRISVSIRTAVDGLLLLLVLVLLILPHSEALLLLVLLLLLLLQLLLSGDGFRNRLLPPPPSA